MIANSHKSIKIRRKPTSVIHISKDLSRYLMCKKLYNSSDNITVQSFLSFAFVSILIKVRWHLTTAEIFLTLYVKYFIIGQNTYFFFLFTLRFNLFTGIRQSGLPYTENSKGLFGLGELYNYVVLWWPGEI